MNRALLAVLLSATVLVTDVDALTPEHSWPGGLLFAQLMQYDQVMAEICLESQSDSRSSGLNFGIGSDFTISRSLSVKEAQALALTLCEGALVGLVRGLQIADPPYGPFGNTPGCPGLSNIGGHRGDVLRGAFRLGYKEDQLEEPTIQVLLRGLWRIHDCEGEPPTLN